MVGSEKNDTGNAQEPAALKPRTGATTAGVPLAFNREPDWRLRKWVSRSMVAVAAAEDDSSLEGLLCNDAAYLRSAVEVDWVATTADGPLEIRDETFLCGQHSKAMPLRYKGGIKVAGLMFRPGAMRALFGLDEHDMLDRITSIESVGIGDHTVTGLYEPGIDPGRWLKKIESWLANYIEKNNVPAPDPLSQALELQAFRDPNVMLNDFADREGVTPRQLQRIAKRDFGLTPKQIMRRARILDLAARLCGVADEEEQDILLRFFDQAHQIREFQAFFGTTPGSFKRRRSSLLTLSLEIRQARRLEMLERIQPGAVRPWMRSPLR